MKKKTAKEWVRFGIKWGLFVLLFVGALILVLNHDAMMKYFDGVGTLNPDTKEMIWTSEPAYMKVPAKDIIAVWWYRYGLKGLVLTTEIVGAAVTIAVLLHFISLIPFESKKAKTISRLLENFIKWVVFIASIFLIMAAWGADSIALLTSAGVLTLIIGLGSQSLVADILAGIFIVFEGDFQVGDIIIVDGWRGEVLEIGIRTTKLIDAGGNIKIVNNSNAICQSTMACLSKRLRLLSPITSPRSKRPSQQLKKAHITKASPNWPIPPSTSSSSPSAKKTPSIRCSVTLIANS